MNSLVRRGVMVVALSLSLLPMFGAVAGATTPSISRSYTAIGKIEPGNIVSLTSLESKSVTLANTTNSDKIIGVAVDSNDSIIVVDPDSGKVQITTSGMASVLVSDLNGSIKAGDKVAVSPFDGIGMKSGTDERIIGLAQTGFPEGSEVLTTKQVTDKQGHTRTVRVGTVQIHVVIGNDDSGIEARLNGAQRLVRSLTGRIVSTARIVISFAVMVATLVTLSVMVYSAVYGSIVATGRNPLAKESILQSLRYALIIAGVLLLTSIAIIYLLLR